jgi:hypothetical protein
MISADEESADKSKSCEIARCSGESLATLIVGMSGKPEGG